MKIKVDQDKCIGCGACVSLSDQVFDLNDDGISVVKVKEVNEELKKSAIEAMESCPTSAIVEVNEEERTN